MPGDGGGGSGVKEGLQTGRWKFWEGDGYIHYLDCGDDFTGA